MDSMVDGQDEEGARVVPRPPGRHQGQGEGVPASRQGQGEGRAGFAIQAGVKPRPDPGLDRRAQVPHRAWVLIAAARLRAPSGAVG